MWGSEVSMGGRGNSVWGSEVSMRGRGNSVLCGEVRYLCQTL